jgi:hypothetical protein
VDRAKPADSGKSKNLRAIVHTPKDPLAIRTLVISGLPPSIDAKILWKKIRKQEGAEKVEWPVKLKTGEEDLTQGASSSSPPKTFGMPEETGPLQHMFYSLISKPPRLRLRNFTPTSTKAR